MKTSQLQLVGYLTPEMSVKANPKFDPEKTVELNSKTFKVDVEMKRSHGNEKDEGPEWFVQMSVIQDLKKTNVPYEFKIIVVASFAFPDPVTDKLSVLENQVRLSGSNILYGIVRERVREMTAAGPWGTLLVPTLSFDGEKETPRAKPKQKTR